MSKQDPQITWTFSSNDVADYRDLALRLALRTLLYTSFADVDLDTVLDVLRSEADSLHHKMIQPPMQIAKLQPKPSKDDL